MLHRSAYPSQRTGAQYNLAMSLLKGMGIEANAEEATYWFQKAAAQAPIVYTKADRSVLRPYLYLAL